jgi:hypothetical protein
VATFSDASATVALDRFLAAADAEAWLFYAAQADSDLYENLTAPPKADPRDPGAFAAQVLQRAGEYAAALASAEENLLERAVRSGFTLHRVRATRRGTAMPAARWLCVSVAPDGRARLDLPSRLKPVTRAASPTLRGRLLATSALRGGLISNQVFVWRADGWKPIDMADQIIVVASVPGGADTGATLKQVNDVLHQLFDISQRARIARARARQPEVGRRLASVDRLIASLPSTVKGVVSRLRRTVAAELTGRPDAPSLAGELERRVVGRATTSAVDDLVAAAQVAAADWDYQRSAMSA